MSYYSLKDVGLILEKSADQITINLGSHSATITIGEWSKLIATPSVSQRVVLPLHREEIVE